MRDRDRRVVFDREEAVRDRDEDLVRHAQQFAHEAPLLVEAADVLEHRVGNGETEGPVGEGQRAVRRDSDIFDAREGAAEVLSNAFKFTLHGGVTVTLRGEAMPNAQPVITSETPTSKTRSLGEGMQRCKNAW